MHWKERWARGEPELSGSCPKCARSCYFSARYWDSVRCRCGYRFFVTPSGRAIRFTKDWFWREPRDGEVLRAQRIQVLIERQQAEDDAERERKEEEARLAREEAERRRQEELERQAQERAEAERQKTIRERVERNRPLWLQRPHLARCRTNESHVYPEGIGSKCPLCGSGVIEFVDVESGMSQEEFLTEYAWAEFLPPGSPVALDPDAPVPRETEAADLEEQVAQLLAIRDFPGIGNLMLEVLLLIPQEREPRPSGVFLAEQIDGIVANRFGLHDAVTYQRPLRDVLLPPDRRSRWGDPLLNWEHDTFHQLVIFAHVLGATWQNFPRPYNRLRPFYLDLAARQTAILEQKARERSGLDRVLAANYPPEIQQLRLQALTAPRNTSPVTEDDE